jgi:hypothetical protein
LIRHADLNPTIAVDPLTVTVVEFAFGTLLVFAIRLSALLASYILPAPIAAIPVATVTMAANIKCSVATAAEAFPENDLPVLAHPRSIAGWTSWPVS